MRLIGQSMQAAQRLAVGLERVPGMVQLSRLLVPSVEPVAADCGCGDGGPFICFEYCVDRAPFICQWTPFPEYVYRKVARAESQLACQRGAYQVCICGCC